MKGDGCPMGTHRVSREWKKSSQCIPENGMPMHADILFSQNKFYSLESHTEHWWRCSKSTSKYTNKNLRVFYE
jgi:hypothetical protein